MGNKKNRNMYKNLALITQVGLNVIIPILLGVYAGQWLDKKFGKNMIFTISLLIIGALSGFMNLFKLAGKITNDEGSDKPDEDDDDGKKDD